MQFETAEQGACYEKVAPWVKKLFGERAQVRDDVPLIDITVGSALAQVGFFPLGPNATIVVTRAYLVAGANLTPDLLRYLLVKNVDKRFGAFAVDADGQILFQHTIVGATCDKVELQASVASVAQAADDFDDEIVRQWGGQRVRAGSWRLGIGGEGCRAGSPWGLGLPIIPCIVKNAIILCQRRRRPFFAGHPFRFVGCRSVATFGDFWASRGSADPCKWKRLVSTRGLRSRREELWGTAFLGDSLVVQHQHFSFYG